MWCSSRAQLTPSEYLLGRVLKTFDRIARIHGSSASTSAHASLSGAELLDARQMRAAAADLDSELMQGMPDPATFDLKYRSPCWIESREQGAPLRCLPAALISGVFHSGSSSLATKLLHHPDIVSDSSGNSQFWAEEGKTAQDYIRGFATASSTAQARPRSALIIDQSPSTFSFYWSAGEPLISHVSTIMTRVHN